MRQRRATCLSVWTDGDGMLNLRGRFDPLLALGLSSRLDAAVATRFAEQTPEFCPTDPVEKNRFLAAHALCGLVTGADRGGDGSCRDGSCRDGRPRVGRPEYVAVIDADAPYRVGPVVEWSIPVELPARVIAQLTGDSDVVGVVVRNGVVLYAPGELNLGRTTRLASRAQRRALRALYSTCAIPGCSVGYDRCKLHHVIWWRNGGRTDLDNLVPCCSRHHSNIHNDGWTIHLGPNRQLTLRLPDGTIHNTGPPTRNTG